MLLGLLGCLAAMSQNLEEINDLMGKQQFREAKAGIDKFLSNPKKASDAEGWYFKGRIYNALSHDNSVSKEEQFNLKSDAFGAFQKYQSLDAKDNFMKMEGYTSYLDLYGGYYDLGVREYNDKSFEKAIRAFRKAIEVKDFILAKRYEYEQTKLYPLDTALVLNIASSAYQLKNEELAVEFYNMLIDARVSGPDYLDVYKFVLEYYAKKDNDAAYQKLLLQAKELYPKEKELWTELDLRAVAKKGDSQLLMAKYEQLLKEDPRNFVLSYNYAVEVYNSMYGKEATKAGDSAVSDKLVSILQQAIQNEGSDDVTATMLMCNHLYNYSSDLLNAANAIKGAKPDEVKRRTEKKAIANKKMDECIGYSEKAIAYYETLSSKTPLQKANYRILINYMVDIYGVKKNAAKETEYEKKAAAADKL